MTAVCLYFGFTCISWTWATCQDGVRIFIWPRQSIVGHKDPGDFCIAVCELAGQMLVYNPEAYANIDENMVRKAHETTCQAELFDSVKRTIIDLLENKID